MNAWMLDREVGLLDAGSDASAFERIGTLAIAVSAAAAAVLAITRSSASCAVLAALLGFLLLDDASGLHEHVPGWRLVYLPILVPVFYLLWRLQPVTPAARRSIRAGLLLLALSAFGGAAAERVTSHQGWRPGDFGYEAKILVKDGSEVAGWILIAIGVGATALPEVRR